MIRQWSAVLGACLAAIACGEPGGAPPAAEKPVVPAGDVLPSLAVPANEVTATCEGTWTARPLALTAEGETSRVLTTVLRFWFEFGTELEVPPESVRKGVSTAYHREGSTGTLTVIALAFRTPEDARPAVRALERRFPDGTQRYLHRGTYVVMLSKRAPVPEACETWLWNEVGRRLEAAG